MPDATEGRKRVFLSSRDARKPRDWKPEFDVKVFSAIPLQPWTSVWVNIGDKRKHGDLLCVPERFIIAMQAAGFHLIDKVIWAKEVVDVDGSAAGQCMIEPATRRLNGNGWEPMYRFVIDTEQAWSDTCAVRIPRHNVNGARYRPESLMRCNTSLEGRNLTNVWRIPVPRNGAGHFAATIVSGAPYRHDLPGVCH